MIIYNNNYVGAFEKGREKLVNHYTGVSRQNKSYSNPQAHILDKYMNPHSSCYRADIAQKGWNNVKDLVVGIRFKDGRLYNI